MKKLLLTGLLLAVSACGGGGGYVDESKSHIQNINIATTDIFSQSVVSTTLAVVEQKYFNEHLGKFPDLKFYYDNLCGNNTQVSHFFIVDLNNDGLKDLVFSLWCDLNGYAPNLYGTNYTGEIPNALIVLYQQPDNSFYVANEEIFGKKIVNIGGPGGTLSGDFNGDGKIDLVFTVAKEDGRAYVEYSNKTTSWDAYPYVLLSKNTGFELQKLNFSFINNFPKVIKGPNNKDDIVIAGNKFSYNNSAWSKEINYNWIERSTLSYSSNNTPYIFTNVYTETEFGIAVYKLYNSTWQLVNKKIFANMSKVNTLNPSEMSYTNQYLISYNNQYWLIPSISETCIIENTNSSTTFIATFEGMKLDSYNGELLIFPNNTTNILPNGKQLSWSNYVRKLIKVKVENDVVVSHEWLDYEHNDIGELICRDLNNDKLADITLTKIGVNVKPIVLLNNQNNFTQVSTEIFPDTPNFYNGAGSYLHDINNDGKADLIYYPIHGLKDKSYTGPYTFQIHNAGKLLNY